MSKMKEKRHQRKTIKCKSCNTVSIDTWRSDCIAVMQWRRCLTDQELHGSERITEPIRQSRPTERLVKVRTRNQNLYKYYNKSIEGFTLGGFHSKPVSPSIAVRFLALQMHEAPF